MNGFFYSPVFAVLVGMATSVYSLFLLRWSLQRLKTRKTMGRFWLITFLRWLPVALLTIEWARHQAIHSLVIWLGVFMISKWLLLIVMWKTNCPVFKFEQG